MTENYLDKIIGDIKNIRGPQSYIKLLVFWVFLEAWIDDKFGPFKTAKECVDYLRENKKKLFDIYDGIKSEAKGLLNNAVAQKVKILPPKIGKKNKNSVHLYYNAQNNAGDMLALLYEIRNKVAHAEWQLDASSPKEPKVIVELAALFIERWIRLAREYRVFVK